MGLRDNLAKPDIRIDAENTVPGLRIRDIFSPSRVCPFTENRSEAHRLVCTKCMEKICERLREIGLDDHRRALPWNERPACGARTRSGSPCSLKVVPGKKRCRLHGGLSTGPRTESGKARIAEAQRRRWAATKRQNSEMPGPHSTTPGTPSGEPGHD